MENKEVIKKYGIRKKTALLIMGQVVLMIMALIVTLVGTTKTHDSIHRIIIYTGQSISCIAIILYGVVYFNKRDIKYFRTVIISYALLEALRVSLLSTNGIPDVPAVLAKLLLVILACDCVLLSERIGKKEGMIVSYAMLALEILLYMVFIIWFPAVRTRLLFIAMPFVGILIAGSICMFNMACIERDKLK